MNLTDLYNINYNDKIVPLYLLKINDKFIFYISDITYFQTTTKVDSVIFTTLTTKCRNLCYKGNSLNSGKL